MRLPHLVQLVALCWIGGEPARADDTAPSPRDDFVVRGYLPDYRAAQFDPVAARGLTDLIVFSAEPTAAGPLGLSRLKSVPWARLRAFKTHERVRLTLCIGGWGRSTHFAAVAGSPEKRSALVKSAVRTCLDERLDGVDLDWEHPKNRAEEEGYGALLAELRSAFEPHGLVLSVTIAAWQRLPQRAFAAVDRVHLMAYDHNGRHSTFEAARKDAETLIAAGVPAAKIVLGLPFYGRGVKDRRRTLAYREIVARHDPQAEADEVDGVYFNGPATIRRKTAFAHSAGLGGVMVWELGQDAAGERSLLRAILAEVDRARK
jgi:GH18 family chitinase